MTKPAPREEAVIRKAETTPSGPPRVQLTVYLTADMVERIDVARKADETVTLALSQYIRKALLEKLIRDGF